MTVAASPDVTTAPHRAPGVEYQTRSECQALSFFRCDALRSTMSTEACARNWRRQRDAALEDRSACHGCNIGAAHAGEEPDRRSSMFGLPFCNRCRRRAQRLVGGMWCPSCYNRARELRVGRNSKGHAPKKLRLVPARIGLVIDPGGAGERYIEIAEPAVRDSIEVAVAALRVVDGAVAITRPRGDVPPMTITELARMFGAKPTRLSGDDRRAAGIVRRHGGGRRRGIVARAPPRARGVVT
jgi:hypothetical protein